MNVILFLKSLQNKGNSLVFFCGEEPSSPQTLKELPTMISQLALIPLSPSSCRTEIPSCFSVHTTDSELRHITPNKAKRKNLQAHLLCIQQALRLWSPNKAGLVRMGPSVFVPAWASICQPGLCYLTTGCHCTESLLLRRSELAFLRFLSTSRSLRPSCPLSLKASLSRSSSSKFGIHICSGHPTMLSVFTKIF